MCMQSEARMHIWTHTTHPHSNPVDSSPRLLAYADPEKRFDRLLVLSPSHPLTLVKTNTHIRAIVLDVEKDVRLKFADRQVQPLD